MMDLASRLDNFSYRLAQLEAELAELRELAHRAEPTPAAPPPPPPTPAVAPPQPRPHAVARPVAPPRPRRRRREIDWSALLGAKALAWAGGAVTVLGIVFFFVLAVNRGWIGPVARISLGAIASALLFGAGLFIKRRYDELYHSALAAVGAGIAGGYMTLLAAKLLYGLVPDWGALLIAAGIAAVGTATALAWSSELIAGIGLVGATLAPAAVGLQAGQLSAGGMAFAGIVFAGTAAVAIRQRWSTLFAVGVAASLPQAFVLLAQSEPTDWSVVAATAFLWALYLGSAAAWQDRLESPALASLPASLTLLSAVYAFAGAATQFDEQQQGWALLAVVSVYGALAAALFPTRRHRDLSALLGAIGLGLMAVGIADLVSGAALAVAWAAEAAILAWLSRRIGDVRYQIVSVAYLGAAAVHTLAFDAPLSHLYEPTAHPARGIAALLGLAAAAGVAAWYFRPWGEVTPARGVFALVEPFIEGFRAGHALWRSMTGWAGALAALYAASLATLGIAQWISSAAVEPAFEWGHVAVTGLWGVAALAVLAAGLSRRQLEVRSGGLVWLGVLVAETYYFAGTELEGPARGWAYLVAAAALVAAPLLDRSRARDELSLVCAAGAAWSGTALAAAGLYQLVEGKTAENLALLPLAALLFALAAWRFRRDRDLSTLLWSPALVVTGYASWQLLEGNRLVLAWAATSAALAGVAWLTREKRFELASFLFLALAVGRAIFVEAPLGDLFSANRHPEAGIPSILFAIGAAVAFSLALTRGEPGELPETPNVYHEVAHMLDGARSFWQRAAEVTAAVLCVYATSLAILGLAEAVGGAGVTTNFQRGHTAVSALWGLIGLALLYAGLKRGLNWLRLVGFGLFGLALAKLFLYDLTFLSSITRALSFLAVGAVLLIAGFFVQRLGSERDARAP